MTNREWIAAVLEGRKDVPVAQQWMGFFHAGVARKLTPEECHYHPMWLYDAPEEFDMSPIGPEALERMIRFNEYTDRCMAGLGKGANISFGHGGPGEFFIRLVEKKENEMIFQYETGVYAKFQLDPYFYHNYEHPVETLDDLNRLDLPDPTARERYAGFAEDARYLKSRGEYVLGSLNGFFSSIHYFLMDYETMLAALIVEPELIHAAVERIGSWNITAAKKMIESGADCIALCDDLGTKQSLLMSPEHYRTFFKPWHKKLCDVVHEMGGTVHFHSHGAITPLLDDFVECGFDFINPFDPEEGFDLEHLLQNYSDKFVVVGGIPASFWEWQPEQQRMQLEKMARLGKKYGRFIFMDSGGIPENVTSEDYRRIAAISRTLRGVAI